MTKPIFVIREPKWSVYVDTDDEAIALIIAIAVRLRAGQIQTVDWAEKPNLIRDLVDISIFKNPQDLPRNSLLGCLKSLEPKSPPGLPAGLRFARCITYPKDCGSICGLL